MKNSSEIALRSWGIFALFALLTVMIFAKILYIQIAQADRWKTHAAGLEQRIQDIEPTRGQIFSSDGRLLATSVPVYDLYWDSKAEGIQRDAFDRELDSLCLGLARILGKQSADGYKRSLLEARRLGRRYHPVHKRMAYTDMKALSALPIMRRGSNRSGFVFQSENIRTKPFSRLAARTIGLQRDSFAVGLELAYNNELAGQRGKQMMERIAGNVWKPASDNYIVEPKEGLDIISTIDIHLQDVAHAALERQLIHHEAAWGTVVVMEVETGFVRAIANLKRDNETGEYSETFNFAIGEAVEPGSTFKLASIIALLDDGLVQLTDSVDTGNGIVYFHGKAMHDSNSHEGGSGVLSVADVFAKSSNVGTAKLISQHFSANPQRLLDKFGELGLREPLNIRIAGETSPRIYKKAKEGNWSGLSLTQKAIGYEVMQKPLQTLALYNAVANGGKMMQPQFVEAIQRNGTVIERNKPVVLREQICNASTLEKCRKIMEMVCLPGGTADFIFKSTPYTVAGKTGTARISHGGGYYPNRYRASFVGYFPADRPKYSCIVLINDTKSGVYYGSSVSAPVFKELANKIYATRLDMSSGQGDLLVSSDHKLPLSRGGSREALERVFKGLGIAVELAAEGEWVRTTTRDTDVQLDPIIIDADQVPDVRGMGLQDALHLLENSGLRVRVNGTGTVRSQSITPGSPLKNHREINIELS